MALEYDRGEFEARMLKLNPTTNLRRYVTSPPEYKSKTVQAAWKLWQEAWQRGQYHGRRNAHEQRRVAYQFGHKDASSKVEMAAWNAEQMAETATTLEAAKQALLTVAADIRKVASHG